MPDTSTADLAVTPQATSVTSASGDGHERHPPHLSWAKQARASSGKWSMTTDTLLWHSIQHLQQVGLFEGIALDELTSIARAATRRRVAAGAFLFHQGDPATVLYIPVQGRLKLTQVTPDGHEVILRYVGSGEMTGATALFGETQYPASAEAVEDVEVLGWDEPTMFQLIARYPRFTLNVLHMLSKRIQELQDRLREMSTERVERRIARALLRLVSQLGRKADHGVLIDLPLSRQDIANMTGTTLYTVSRVLSRWEEDGLIEAGRERVLIRNPRGMVVIAEDLPPIEPAEK